MEVIKYVNRKIIKISEITFYADKSVPPPIIQYLKELHFSVIFENDSSPQIYNEHYYLQQSKFKEAILLTTNQKFLDWALISVKDMHGACVVVFKADDTEGNINLYGPALYNLIKNISSLRKNQLHNIKIEIGKTIKFYYASHGIKRIEEFDVSWRNDGECVFKKIQDDTSDGLLYKLLKFAVPKAMRGTDDVVYRYVSFQRLDTLIPQDRGELLGEITSRLFDNGVLVFSQRSESLKGIRKIVQNYKNDNLFLPDSEVRKIINEVLIEQETHKLEGFYPQESISITPSDIGVEDELMADEITITLPSMPILSNVNPTETVGESLLLEIKPKILDKPRISDSLNEDEEGHNDFDLKSYQEDLKIPKVYDTSKIARNRRISSIAQITGRRAEEIVMKYLIEKLLENEKKHIRWVSVAGEKPGWDIEYVGSDGKLIAIEVKGTIRKSFVNIKISANEWEAASELKDKYWLYLVSDSHSKNPQIQRIQNPVGLKETGKLQVTPMSWLIELVSH